LTVFIHFNMYVNCFFFFFFSDFRSCDLLPLSLFIWVKVGSQCNSSFLIYLCSTRPIIFHNSIRGQSRLFWWLEISWFKYDMYNGEKSPITSRLNMSSTCSYIYEIFSKNVNKLCVYKMIDFDVNLSLIRRLKIYNFLIYTLHKNQEVWA
jgi:hypothetical protein